MRSPPATWIRIWIRMWIRRRVVFLPSSSNITFLEHTNFFFVLVTVEILVE